MHFERVQVTLSAKAGREIRENGAVENRQSYTYHHVQNKSSKNKSAKSIVTFELTIYKENQIKSQKTPLCSSLLEEFP